jgi:hypothetical protein
VLFSNVGLKNCQVVSAQRRDFVWFEVFKAMAMKNAVFWDVTPCGSYKNRLFGRVFRLHHLGDKNRLPLLVTANICPSKIWGSGSSETSVLTRATRRNNTEDTILNICPSLSIFVTLMMGAISSSETCVLTRATRRNIPKDGIFQKCDSSVFRSATWFWSMHQTVKSISRS